MSVRLFAVLVVVIPLVVGASPERTSADEEQRVELAETVTLAGEQPGVLPVRLPGPATVSLAASSQAEVGFEEITIDGDGGLQGFWLVDDPVQRTAELLVVRHAHLDGDWRDSGREIGFSRVETEEGVHACGRDCDVELPAGDYRLYLIADDTPTSITVRFHGLGGEVTLTPEQQLDAPQMWLESPGLTGVAEVWRDRDSASFESDGAIFSVQWDIRPATDTIHQATAHGACRWVGQPPTVDANGPGCPDGERHGFWLGGGTSGPTTSSMFRGLSLSYDFAAGPYTLGAWGGTGGSDAHTGMAAVFLPYGPEVVVPEDGEDEATDHRIIVETSDRQEREARLVR